jgi:pyruvate/2-oxoglutarate dehydrogenase complex dihydrolipoamide acyltransferase (E2) component
VRLLPIWLIRPVAAVTGLLTAGLGISARPIMSVTATIDHRFIDGLQGATLTRVVKEVLENPWTLEGLESPPAV